MSLYDLSKKGPKFPMDTKRIYHRDAQIDSGMVSTSPWTIGLSTKNPEKLKYFPFLDVQISEKVDTLSP